MFMLKKRTTDADAGNRLRKDIFRMAKLQTLVIYAIECVLAIVVGGLTENFSLPVMFGVFSIILASMYVLVRFYTGSQINETVGNILQLIMFWLITVILSFAFRERHMLFFTVFIQCFVVIIYMKRSLCIMQAVAQSIMLLIFCHWKSPLLGTHFTTFEWVAALIEIWVINSLDVILIRAIVAQDQRNYEINQKLDAALQDLEVKCEEANAATKAKSDFLSSMSHEIRTPINAILGMNEMIIRESHEDNVQVYASHINSSGRMLLSLINDVLDSSKIEAGKMEVVELPYSLSRTIREVVLMIRPMAKKKNLELVVVVAPNIPDNLFGDEVRIRQILTNLLTNAVKYTDYGKIHLVFDFEPKKDGNILLKFEVDDTGRGIKNLDKDKLFNSFQRLDIEKNNFIEGTGLGLTITNRLLKMLGGSIDVDSVYGVGTQFRVELPQVVVTNEIIGDFSIEKTEQIEKNDYQESFRAPDARILVVDDNQMNLLVTENLLKQTMVQVSTVTSGQAALKLLEHEHYDIILMDHMMPEMDGIETLKRIRASKLAEGTPIIVLTANVVAGSREQYLRDGFQDHLTKPIDPQKLEIALRTWIGADKTYLNPNLQNKGLRHINLDVAKTYCKNDVRLFCDKLRDCVEECEPISIGLMEAYKECDWIYFRTLIHSLRDIASSLGASALAERAGALEQSAGDENVDLIDEGMNVLLEQYKEVANEAAKELSLILARLQK